MTILEVPGRRWVIFPEKQSLPASGVIKSIWWQTFLVGIIALAILAPRGLSIGQAQTLRVDDGYHLARGIRFWHKAIPANWLLNDPTFGEAISALPILFAKELPRYDKLTDIDILWKLSQHSINRISVFKSILFVPAVMLIFFWVARIYGAEAGWLAAALVLIDPTFAAHIPLPTIDVLGVETILFAWFFTWEFLCRPTWWRAALVGICIAIAMQTKHTAVIAPGVAITGAMLCWIIRPLMNSTATQVWMRRLGRGVALSMLVVLVWIFAMWALTLFDVSVPHLPPGWPSNGPQWGVRLSQIRHAIPGGLYFTAFLGAVGHGVEGHCAILFGQMRDHGWWYYFPAIATMKVPLGFFVIFILAIGSLFIVPPRWEEWSLLVPGVAWTTFIMWSKLNIGFRHFLPAYVFILMLAGRAVTPRRHWWRLIVWCGATWAAVNVASWQPDYLSYVNRDIDQVWLQMSDSNIDWSQGNKEVDKWIKSHVAPTRLVTLVDFSGHPKPEGIGPNLVLGAPPPWIDLHHQPTTGIYIVSPNFVTDGYVAAGQELSALRRVKPIDIIGHSILVYDLDLAGRGKPFNWFDKLPSMRVPEGP